MTTGKKLFWGGVIVAGVTAAMAYLGGKELRAGEYTIDLQSDKAVVKSGKAVKAEAPVKVEENGHKYGTTVVRISNTDGKMNVQEIRLGGTHTKLVFNP